MRGQVVQQAAAVRSLGAVTQAESVTLVAQQTALSVGRYGLAAVQVDEFLKRCNRAEALETVGPGVVTLAVSCQTAYRRTMVEPVERCGCMHKYACMYGCLRLSVHTVHTRAKRTCVSS